MSQRTQALEELSLPLINMKKKLAALDSDIAAKIQSKVSAQFKKEVRVED